MFSSFWCNSNDVFQHFDQAPRGNFRGTKQIWIDPATVAVVKTHHLHWKSIHVVSLKYGNPSSICETFKNEMNQNIPQLSRRNNQGQFFFRWKGWKPTPLDANQCFLQSQVTAAQIRGAAWCFCGPGSLGLGCHKGDGFHLYWHQQGYQTSQHPSPFRWMPRSQKKENKKATVTGSSSSHGAKGRWSTLSLGKEY